jgi:hypothetical protein
MIYPRLKKFDEKEYLFKNSENEIYYFKLCKTKYYNNNNNKILLFKKTGSKKRKTTKKVTTSEFIIELKKYLDSLNT